MCAIKVVSGCSGVENCVWSWGSSVWEEVVCAVMICKCVTRPCFSVVTAVVCRALMTLVVVGVAVVVGVCAVFVVSAIVVVVVVVCVHEGGDYFL